VAGTLCILVRRSNFVLPSGESERSEITQESSRADSVRVRVASGLQFRSDTHLHGTTAADI